jgi:hypothetical protein
MKAYLVIVGGLSLVLAGIAVPALSSSDGRLITVSPSDAQHVLGGQHSNCGRDAKQETYCTTFLPMWCGFLDWSSCATASQHCTAEPGAWVDYNSTTCTNDCGQTCNGRVWEIDQCPKY